MPDSFPARKPIPGPQPSRRRLEDVSQIGEALGLGESSLGVESKRISLLLCREGALSASANLLVDRARGLGISVLVESEREMRRMSAGEKAPQLIAFEGHSPDATLDELMSREGLVFVLARLRYPGNVGFILRSAEVAGAAGVVLANDWEGSQLSEALRVGMRADRFFPVLEGETMAAIASARRAGRRIVALETVGTKAPWDVDLRAPAAIIVGGEASGLSESILESVDDIIRIPTRGFIPSYNVQAVVGVILGEWLRQNLE